MPSDSPLLAPPSPTSEFADYLPRVTKDLDDVTTHAAGLPGKSDLSFHRTLDRKLAKELDEASDRILKLTGDLLELLDTGKNGKKRRWLEDEEDVKHGYKRGVVEVVDALLEDADSCLDELNGQKKKAAIEVKASLAAQAGKKMPGPFSASADLQTKSTAANMVKPQTRFPDEVDNSHTRLQHAHTLPYKHHAMVPLGHHHILDYTLDSDPGKAAWQLRKEKKAMEHPYYYETKHIPYPTSMFTLNPPIVPPPMDQNEAIWIDTPEALAEMVEELKAASEIGVDLEHHDRHSYYGFTCLMQISTREKDWLVDTLKLRGALREDKLGGVMADPSIVKVFHGADSDIPWLQKDFGIYVVNLFDTYHATKVLGMTSHSLANLLILYCGYHTDKKYQLADWRIRPLSFEMKQYAQADTHFILSIYDNLRNALLEKSRPPTPEPGYSGSPAPSAATNPQRLMRQVLDLSGETALKLYEREPYDAEHGKDKGGWISAMKRAWNRVIDRNTEPATIFRRLHEWRDNVAREEDEAIYTVLSNLHLGMLARNPPANVGVIASIVRRGSPIAAKRADQIFKVIQDAKAEAIVLAEEKDALEAAKTASPSPSPKGVHTRLDTPEVTTSEPPTSALNPAVPSVPSSEALKQAGQTPNTGDFDAVFSAVFETPTAASSSKTKPKAGASKLFGKTISTKPAEPVANASKRKTTSSLFGSTSKPSKAPAPNAKSSSPSFAEINQAILAELAPPKPAVVEQEEETAQSSRAEPNVLPEPETVPFVPASARTTGFNENLVVASSTASSTKPSKPTKPLKEPSPEPVVVKMSKKQRKREREAAAKNAETPASGTSSDVLPLPASSSSVPAPGPDPEDAPPLSKKQKKDKKKKIEAKDIPEFDYSSVPNLLDNPEAATGGRKKKGKKDKKDKKEDQNRVVVTGSTFGKVAQDKSQPKGGNRSKTFS